MAFDRTVVQATAFSVTDALTGFLFAPLINNQTGVIEFIAVSSTPMNGDTIANLSFQVLNAGASDLTLQDVEIINSAGDTIAVELLHGRVVGQQ